jgi:hypothetical protein
MRLVQNSSVIVPRTATVTVEPLFDGTEYSSCSDVAHPPDAST